jgi:hypothetical protein
MTLEEISKIAVKNNYKICFKYATKSFLTTLYVYTNIKKDEYAFLDRFYRKTDIDYLLETK